MHNNRNIRDPTLPNWGGQYTQIYQDKQFYFSDDFSKGNESVSMWRVDYLNDWTNRLKWLYN